MHNSDNDICIGIPYCINIFQCHDTGPGVCSCTKVIIIINTQRFFQIIFQIFPIFA